MCLLLPILTFATFPQMFHFPPAFQQVCQMFLLPSFPACKLAQGKGCSVICLFFYTMYFFTRRKVAISYSSSYIHNSIMWLTLLILAHALGCIELGGKIKKVHFTYWLTLFSLWYILVISEMPQNDQFPQKWPFSSISEMVKIYHWNWFQCIKPSRVTPMVV